MIDEHKELPMSTEGIFLDVDADSQRAVFTKLATLTKELGFIRKEKKLVKAFLHREKESTTGFGDGFAIPHALNRDIKKTGIFFMRLKNGVDWESLDNKPVKFIIALLVPKSKASEIHMELLSTVAQNTLKPKTQAALANSNDKDEILRELIG